MEQLVRGWDALRGLLFPEVCEACDKERAGRDEGYVCPTCLEHPGNVRKVTRPYCTKCGLPYPGEIDGDFECGNCSGQRLEFDWARASLVATPFLLHLVHRYKYSRAVWLGPRLGRWLVEEAETALSNNAWDGLIPVPLHPLREREREFNQAECLARWLGKATGIPVRSRWVRRRSAGRVQASLDRRERARNVSGAFEASTESAIRGGRFVVVDDVLTTGATTSAVAAALKEAGAERVVVWTLARGA